MNIFKLDSFYDYLYLMIICPCGSQNTYLDCCGAYLQKRLIPKTPLALMRSRYTAFVEKRYDYIRRTMQPPASLKFDKSAIIKRKEAWLGLEIINTSFHETNPDIGFVEFIARYKLDNQEYAIHEKSEFHFKDGRWYYVDGKPVTGS